jgi:lambda family phage portal protein
VRLPKLKPNFLDRAISYVDPLRGARRMHARAMMALVGGYVGARKDRPATREWRLTNNSADVDQLPDLPVLRDRSRDLERNAPLATGAIGTVVQSVGTLTLQAKPDWQTLGMTEAEADAWTEITESEFALFAESLDCDVTHTQNFYGLQGLAFHSTLSSGDVITLLPMLKGPRRLYSLALQIIEADRLETPRGVRDGGKRENGNMISGGVELDANGAPVAYHILDAHPGSIEGRSAGSKRIPAYGNATGRRAVIHLFDRTRPGQHRGMPYLAPVIETLKQLDRYTEAEVMASVLSAMFTVFIESEAGQGLDATVAAAASGGGTPTGAEKQKEIQLGSGGIIDLVPGEKATSFAPNRPNSAFDPFLQAVLRQIGVALGLPFEVLIKHFTASYSAARAAMLEAWKFYKGRREFLATGFCRPVYEVWMEEAVARGRIQAPGFFDRPELRRAYLLSEWIGDAMPTIDAVKDVDAAQKRIELRISTRADETLQLTGKQWTDVERQLTKEEAIMKTDGVSSAPAPAASADNKNPEKPPVNPPPENQGDLEQAEAV